MALVGLVWDMHVSTMSKQHPGGLLHEGSWVSQLWNKSGLSQNEKSQVTFHFSAIYVLSWRESRAPHLCPRSKSLSAASCSFHPTGLPPQSHSQGWKQGTGLSSLRLPHPTSLCITAALLRSWWSWSHIANFELHSLALCCNFCISSPSAWLGQN